MRRPLSNAQRQARPFEAYVIDVEGGEATLFVSPSGGSLLVDSGWPGFGGRDADRILAAAKDADITQRVGAGIVMLTAIARGQRRSQSRSGTERELG